MVSTGMQALSLTNNSLPKARKMQMPLKEVLMHISHAPKQKPSNSQQQLELALRIQGTQGIQGLYVLMS